LAVTGGVRTAGFAHVEYQPDIPLILSILVTSLHSPGTHVAPTKLSLQALEDLIAVATECEKACRSSPATSGEACLRNSAGKSPTTSPSSCGR
jgi:hypothetical protein